MDNVVESMQMSSTMNLPRGVERVKEENHDIKSLLAASNENCWLFTSGPSASREKKVQESARQKNISVKEKDTCSVRHNSKIEAKIALFSI